MGQPHSCHTCTIRLVEPPVPHRTLEKHLEMAGEGRGLPGKCSLEQALPCAVPFLSLIHTHGRCLYLSSPGLIKNPRTVTCLGALQFCHQALAKTLTFVINMTCFELLRSPGFCVLSIPGSCWRNSVTCPEAADLRPRSVLPVHQTPVITGFEELHHLTGAFEMY